jgi:hypothetical protein
VYAALSTDDGASWRIKPLPVSLPHETDLLDFGTLGYSTVRQGRNGVIHILSTMTHPCLHYRINEAWLLSDEPLPNAPPPPPPPPARSRVRLTASTAAGGHAEWGAIIAEGGAACYRLDGTFRSFHPNTTAVEYEAEYAGGARLNESYRDAAGNLLWAWTHEQGGGNTSTFERYHVAGGGAGGAAARRLLARSAWDNRPAARDYDLIRSNPPAFRFTGLTAQGPACLYALDGSIRQAVRFVAGIATPGNASDCSQR